MADRHQQKPYPLRMSEELRKSLESAAEISGRSLHTEIVRRLEDSFVFELPTEKEMDQIDVPDLLEIQRLTIQKHSAEQSYLNAYLASKLMGEELKARLENSSAEEPGKTRSKSANRKMERSK